MTVDEIILSIRDKYKSDIEGSLSVYMKLAILEGYQAGKRDCNQEWLDNLRNAVAVSPELPPNLSVGSDE
jgi:hypothetical protein